MLADPDHEVGEAVEEVVVLALVDVELGEHPRAPAEDVLAQDLVLLVACLQLLLLGHQQLVLVSLEALVVAFPVLLGAALARQDLVLGDEAVVEAVLEVAQLGLEGVDPFERVIVEFVVFLHALEDLVGVDDVGVGLDVVVGAADVLVLLQQVGALRADYLRQDAVRVQHFQDALQLFLLDEGGRDFVDLALALVLLGLEVAQHLPLGHVSLQQGDVLGLVPRLLVRNGLGLIPKGS